MRELSGADWVLSDQKIKSEEQIVRRIMPVARVARAFAIATVAIAEPDHAPISREQRALIPDRPYDITKIGDRGSLGARDPSRKVSELLSTTMIDEIPHLQAVLDGTACLNGPRGTTPDHRARLFDSLDTNRRDEWEEILAVQKHGVINMYALGIHGKPGPMVSYDDEENLQDSQVLKEALVRFKADKHDFEHASAEYDAYLRKKFVKMVLSRATGGRIGVS